jgi:hypothetical protein
MHHLPGPATRCPSLHPAIAESLATSEAFKIHRSARVVQRCGETSYITASVRGTDMLASSAKLNVVMSISVLIGIVLVTLWLIG